MIGLINEKIPHIDKKKYKSGRDSLESLKALQQLQRLEQLQQLQRFGTTDSFFSIQNKDFLDIKITTQIDQTIVYLDPPYRGTAQYEFGVDYDKLDSYFRNSQFTCFMSEYNSPDKEVFYLEKRKLLNQSKGDNVIERLYWNGVL